MRRLLVPPEQIAAGSAVVQGDALHYLLRVLRLGVGDELEVFDGSGKVYPARIVQVGDDAATLSLGEGHERARAPRITLAQGLAKGDKLDLVVQKATELGAARIAPLQLERCVVRLDAVKGADRAKRWRRIAEEAARQCGRADVPAVDEPSGLQAFLAAAASRGEKVAVLWEEEGIVRLGAWSAAHLGEPLALVIGPEGGLTAAEVETVRAAGGAVVGLGPRILRTETAGLAALAVVLHLAGELG
ncbi:16S rRNA (uracil(1498)-N(3))-methyltransferase [Vulgatibacter sp.]|uniref:16S rRNA (uracil(1498)-N(3))-methyltransferase n=1 Tax=Vulgatibacter sp. TaxID=1971226 RepID=UPI0035628243